MTEVGGGGGGGQGRNKFSRTWRFLQRGTRQGFGEMLVVSGRAKSPLRSFPGGGKGSAGSWKRASMEEMLCPPTPPLAETPKRAPQEPSAPLRRGAVVPRPFLPPLAASRQLSPIHCLCTRSLFVSFYD